MNHNEKISVIMPCYNAVATLERTLASVMDQSYQNFKLYAVNDGSTDHTLDILQQYSKQYPDKIHVVSQPNQGQTKAKNTALDLVKGEFIAFIDSDDVWEPEKLAEQLLVFECHPHVGLCYTDGYYLNELDQKTGAVGVEPSMQGRCLPRLLMGNAIVASSVMIRQTLIREVGGFDEQFTACENWELWCRISSVSDLFAITQPLTGYRRHANNMSWNFDRLRDNRLKVISKNQKQFAEQLPELDTLTRKAFFEAYQFLGENALWHLELKKARTYLRQALKVKPFSKHCLKLYLKSLLGSQVLQRLRKARGVQVARPA